MDCDSSGVRSWSRPVDSLDANEVEVFVLLIGCASWLDWMVKMLILKVILFPLFNGILGKLLIHRK